MDVAGQTITRSRVALHYWCLATMAATFVLLCSGGIVTSKGVGMSVPDWPTTYGYNMFLFPISGWVGGIFYEHLHRLIGSLIGLMTMILAAWLFSAEPRRWLKILGLAAFVAVCVQGLLGGLRVTLYKNEIGIFHAVLAQSFFCLLGILAVSTSPKFLRGDWDIFLPHPSLKKLVLLATALILVQLGIGASMRHAHLGLSIPDFPLAYGQVVPDTSSTTLEKINTVRVEDGQMPTTAAQIWLQMKHRIMAFVILGLVAAVAWICFTNPIARSAAVWSAVWLVMIFSQVALGAWTVWSNKAADVATAHMALGALSLLFGVIFSYRLFRASQSSRFVVPDHLLAANLTRVA
ncbi:MAG: COX15/CtaA family protein [Verrucomicrobiota bacterium]